MPLWLLITLYAVWVAWVLQAAAALRANQKFLRRRREADARVDRGYRPFVRLVVPFRGVDRDLARGIAGLCSQDYPRHQLLLVVDSENDPAAAVIREQLALHPDADAQLLVAGPAGADEGQKVRNQLFALDHFYDDASDDEVWVFADSDAVPGSDWLWQLVRPLSRETVAMTTGYRWLVPSEDAGAWSHLASVINSSVAVLLGRDALNYAWGGSMAIRADAAREGDLRGKLRGALCDDYQFTRLTRSLGMRVVFVPPCLVATPVDFDLAALLNFGHRQYLLTRVYAPWLYVAAAGILSLYLLGLLSSLAALAGAGAGVVSREVTYAAAAALAIVALLDQWRASTRRRIVHAAFGEATAAALTRTLRWDRWATPLWMTLHWLFVLRGGIGRTMRWRGIVYRLHGPQRVERIDDAG